MKRLKTSLILSLLFPLLVILFAVAQAVTIKDSSNAVIAVFDVQVDPGSSAFMNRVVNDAINRHSTAIVIDMNTPGGLLSDMMNIISAITKANQSGIPVYTYVEPNGLAASAGSYIAMATKKILMGSGSAIGPSTPIVVGGSALEQNHTQSAMLSLMESLAGKSGRNVTAAYYMVQADEAFSATEAVRFHVADGIANSLSDALSVLGLSDSVRVTESESLYEQFLSALSNPVLDGILILLGVVAIVVDVYHPTIVLTVLGAVAIVAGLIGAEAIDASVLGFFVIAVAAFLIFLELKLGHGFAIIAGVLLGVFGILYLGQGLNYSPSPITAITELELFLFVIIGILAGLYFRWVITPLLRRRKLTGPEALAGQIGVAVTDLTPQGEARVGGIVWRANSISGPVRKGESVRVLFLKDLVVTVEKTVPERAHRSDNKS